MTRAGRVEWTKSVLTSIITHHAIALPLPKWALKAVDKIRKSFVWSGEQATSNGSNKKSVHLINWRVTCSPKELGGLGITDLEKFGSALRQRWLWYSWKKEERPWKGMQTPATEEDKELFAASTRIRIGDGQTAIF